MLSAHLVVQVQDCKVVHATFVRYERRPARIVWAAAAPIHRRIIPYPGWPRDNAALMQ